MNRSIRPLFWAALLYLVGVGPAFAAEIQATSKVAAATIFADRAAVTRTGSVHLPSGVHVVIVGNMPAGFNESSLRVQGKAAASVKIGSVEVKRVFLAELAAATEQEKAKALQAKRDERALIDAELKALQIRASFIERLATNGNNITPQQGTSMTVIGTEKASEMMPEKWQQAWGLLQTGMTETQKGIVAKEIARRAINEEIAKLEKEYEQIRTSKRERRDVAIHVEAANETDFDFTLLYQTPGASWRSLYDARLCTEKGEMKLEQYGQVAQQTGEDWNDVDLTLSTARPELGTEMPRLSEWYIQNYAPRMAMQDSDSRLGSAMRMKAPSKGMSFSGSAEMAAEFEDAPPVPAAPISAQVVETDYSAEFRVPGRVDLKSIAEPAKFFIAGQTMKAELSVQTTPRLSARAYLFAKVANGEKYPVIPGQVAKYRDGAFMGNASIKMLRPGESLDLSFGIDDRVKVTFQKTKEQQTNPALKLIGDITAERYYQMKVKTLHKSAMKITVLDHHPVSREADIKVALLEEGTTPGYLRDPEERQGVIQWTAEYQPLEEKIYNIGFSVKYPKGQTISGF